MERSGRTEEGFLQRFMSVEHGFSSYYAFSDLSDFLGRRLTRRRTAPMQETVGLFPNDGHRVLAATLCGKLDWHTPSGTYRERFRLRVPEGWRLWAS